MIEFKNESKLNENINLYKRITYIISIIRLILVLALIVALICLFSLGDYIFYSILSISIFIVFILLVLLTNKYYKTYNLLLKMKQVYQNHSNRRNLNLNMLHDTGNEFINKDDYKISDLDLFGKNSLFQYLNVGKTYYGRRLLAKQLTNPDEMKPEFTNLVNDLANDEKSLEIEAALLEFKESAYGISPDEIISVLNSKIKFKPSFILPLLSFIGMIFYFIGVFTLGFSFPYITIFVIVNVILSFVLLKNDVYEQPNSKYHTLLLAYKELYTTIKKININNKYLNELINEINPEIASLNNAIHLFSFLAMRDNIIFRIIFDGLFVMDFWGIIIFNHLVNKKYNLNLLFKNTAIIECALSLSIIGIDNSIYTIPKDSLTIEAKNLCHPLVKDCKPNSITFKGGIILTGSNMSGKTTFMRTLGINQILRNAGGLVLGEEYKAPRLDVLTSLRCNDMLEEGVSTFYAEILRMKKMNKAIKEEKTLLLVDEIFKGTNQEERLQASFKVISLFNQYNAFFIISTHDNQLCSAPSIENYHFNEKYTDDKISFDYQIKKGICESKNALYLLKLADIL